MFKEWEVLFWMVRDHSSKTKSEGGLGQRWIVMIVMVVLWSTTKYMRLYHLYSFSQVLLEGSQAVLSDSVLLHMML